MKEEIKKAATFNMQKYKGCFYSDQDEGCAESCFIDGAEWMLNQYQGITPETVKEMLVALKAMLGRFDHVGNRHPLSVEACNEAKGIIIKAEQELNQG